MGNLNYPGERYGAADSQSVTKMLPKSSLIRSTFELITALVDVVIVVVGTGTQLP